jgi:DNA-binding transcriptional ArsR family regulator
MINTKKTSKASQIEVPVDLEQVKKAYFAFRAANHKVRQQMLGLIHKNKQLTVTEIYQKLRIPQSKASTYLAILRKAKLVIATREGQSVYYEINYKNLSFLAKGAKLVNEGKI